MTVGILLFQQANVIILAWKDSRSPYITTSHNPRHYSSKSHPGYDYYSKHECLRRSGSDALRAKLPGRVPALGTGFRGQRHARRLTLEFGFYSTWK